jgi:hypothetical protein
MQRDQGMRHHFRRGGVAGQVVYRTMARRSP